MNIGCFYGDQIRFMIINGRFYFYVGDFCKIFDLSVRSTLRKVRRNNNNNNDIILASDKKRMLLYDAVKMLLTISGTNKERKGSFIRYINQLISNYTAYSSKVLCSKETDIDPKEVGKQKLDCHMEKLPFILSNKIKYGELQNWDEGVVSTPNDFMKLVEGNNKVRVFTNPYQFMVHWNGNRTIRCAINNCPLCKMDVIYKYNWYIGVIDRTSGTAKILEISSQIYKGIKDLVSDPDWGDIKKYDINIRRFPKGSQPLYTVFGNPRKSDFNAEEKKLIANFKERVDISKFTQPPTPEEVAEKIK